MEEETTTLKTNTHTHYNWCFQRVLKEGDSATTTITFMKEEHGALKDCWGEDSSWYWKEIQ